MAQVDIPLASEAALSLGFSTLMFRGVLMEAASTFLSGRHDDSLPLIEELRPVGPALNGKWRQDRPALEAIGLKFPA